MKTVKTITISCCFVSAILLPESISGMQTVLTEASECAKIYVGTVGAACICGIAGEQVTARVCPEFFSKGFHSEYIRLFQDCWLKSALLSKSPTKMGLAWGILEPWWRSVLLSIPIVAASRLGSAPRLGWSHLVKPVAAAIGFMGASSIIAGMVGYDAASATKKSQQAMRWQAIMAEGVPAAKLKLFVAAGYAHEAAYTSGTLAGLGVTGWALYKRLAMPR
jgi:hypothetical protein